MSSSNPYDYLSLYAPYFQQSPEVEDPLDALFGPYHIDSDSDETSSSLPSTPPDEDYLRNRLIEHFLMPQEPPPLSPIVVPGDLMLAEHKNEISLGYMRPPSSIDPKDIFSRREPVTSHFSSTLSDSGSPDDVDDQPFLNESEGDDDDNDADYVPVGKAGSRKRSRSTSFGSSKSSIRPAKRACTVSTSYSPSATPTPSPAPRNVSNNGRQHPPPRNKQVHIDLDVIHEYNFVCPVEECKWNNNQSSNKAGDKRRKSDKSKIDIKVEDDGKFEVPFRRLPDFKRHLISHMKPVNIKCPSCEKPFSRSDALVRHNRTAHPTYSMPSNTRIGSSKKRRTAPVQA